MIAVYECVSLVIVGLPVPKVVSSIDDKVSGIDIVALAGSLKHLGMMNNTIFMEVNLLVLYASRNTFMFVPQNLNSYSSTVKSYFS